jgi:hypothetical protein
MLKGEATKLWEKLIGLCYNMDDHKAIAIGAQEGLDSTKSKLNKLTS